MDAVMLTDMLRNVRKPYVYRTSHFEYYYASIDIPASQATIRDSFDTEITIINIDDASPCIQATRCLRQGIHNFLVQQKVINFNDITVIENATPEPKKKTIDSPTRL